MKKMKVALFTSMMFFGAIEAQAWWNLGANCHVQNGVTGNCVAYNDSHLRLFCKMRVSGRTMQGYWMNVNNNNWVNPGQNISAYVSANNPFIDPMTHVQANVRCDIVPF